MRSAGGWHSILYSLKKAHEVGGVVRLVRALRTQNACKTCALGMGGQRGGMVNEAGHFPEVCKKSIQAMAADMQGRIPPKLFENNDFDRLTRWTPRELESAGRIAEPLYAGAGDRVYRAIGWDEAIERAAGAMRDTPPDESFFYFSGRSSNEAGFLLQLVARLYGTNNVNNCSFFCHQASGVGLSSVTGSGTATVTLEDLDRCDLIVLIGGNPASNHPRFMRSLMHVRRRGGKVIVINPMRELGLVRFKVPSDVRSMLFGSRIADEYLMANIGGDIALLSGLAKAVLEAGGEYRAFLENSCEGWETLKEHLVGLSWESLAKASGVDVEDMRRVATVVSQSQRTIYCWTMGITHHEHGVQNVQAITNLALLRGMVGKPGAGLLPLRGHSNVQGIGSIGGVPNLKQRVLEAMDSRFGVTLPTETGLDTLACVHKADAGSVRFAWHLGGNLYGSCPDSAFARRALAKIGMTVFLSTTLNTGHVLGRGRESLILPVRARDEEDQATTQESMFNFVRLSDGGKPRLEGPRSEVQVIAQIARRALGDECPIDLKALEEHANLRQAISAIIPGYEKIGEIDRTRKEFRVDGRTFHEPRFATPSGRAMLHAVSLPTDPPLADDELRLMTIRSEGQFNTVVYEEEDVYRGQDRRDVILMSPTDIERLGLASNDRVTVTSEVGSMIDIFVRPFDICPGNAAMYYPEANVLVPQRVDGASRTPAFKNIRVRIHRIRRLDVLGGT